MVCTVPPVFGDCIKFIKERDGGVIRNVVKDLAQVRRRFSEEGGNDRVEPHNDQRKRQGAGKNLGSQGFATAGWAKE